MVDLLLKRVNHLIKTFGRLKEILGGRNYFSKISYRVQKKEVELAFNLNVGKFQG